MTTRQGVMFLTEIPAEIHTQTKILAARDRTTLKQWVLRALAQAVAVRRLETQGVTRDELTSTN